MIDIERENLVPLRLAANHYPGSHRPHRATVFRHALKGVAGVRLASVKIGGQRFTSIEEIRRFIAALNAKPAQVVVTASLKSEGVDDKLDAEGF